MRSVSVGDEGGFSAFFEDFVGDLKRIFEGDSDPLQGSSHYQDFNIDDDDEVGRMAAPPISPIFTAAPRAPFSDPVQDAKSMRKRSRTSSLSLFSCCTSPQNLPPMPIDGGGQYSQLPKSATPKHHQKRRGVAEPPAIGVTPTPNRPRMATTDSTLNRKTTRRPSLDDLSASISRRLSFAPGGGAVGLSCDELVEHVRDSFPKYAENDIKRFSRKCGGR